MTETVACPAAGDVLDELVLGLSFEHPDSAATTAIAPATQTIDRCMNPSYLRAKSLIANRYASNKPKNDLRADNYIDTVEWVSCKILETVRPRRVFGFTAGYSGFCHKNPARSLLQSARDRERLGQKPVSVEAGTRWPK
nr:hypothetical protein MFLOJ_24090 [Mycobacterium florentinum]